MILFQKNLGYLYKILKTTEYMNRSRFANLLNVSRGTLFKMMKDDEYKVRVSRLLKIVDLFNKKTGIKITIDDFMKSDLEDMYPLSKIFDSMDFDERNVFKILREVRNISLREAERISKKFFEKDAHLSATYLMRLERGDYKSPSLKKLNALSLIYRVPVELFLIRRSFGRIQTIGNKLIIDMESVENSKVKERKIRQIIEEG